MKPVSLAGIVLVVLGALAMAYQGFDYTRRDHVLDVGPMHVTAETQKKSSHLANSWRVRARRRNCFAGRWEQEKFLVRICKSARLRVG